MKKIIMFMFVLGATAFAEIKTELTAHKLGAEGKKIQTENVIPGETLIYTFTMSNEDKSAYRDLNPSINIQPGTTFIPEKTTPGFKVSLDGKEFKEYPIKDKEGNPVDMKLYRAASWNIPELKGEETKSVDLAAELNSPAKE